MAGRTSRPAQRGLSRVFLIDGRARPDHKPMYQSNMRAGGVSQSFGDIERIEIPSPDEFGKFLEVGTIRGATERVTITLTGRYAMDLKSTMLELARKQCAVDIHVNFGICTNPTDYNTFTKKIILEDGRVTDYSNEDLGALGSDEQGKIDETIDVSAREVYELVQLSFAERGGDVVTNELLDVTVCDTPSCGDCEDESDGCEKIFAISSAAGGSPGTPADVVYSLDGGTTWRAVDVDTLTSAEAPTGVACFGDYLVVVSAASLSLHYALLSEFDGVTDPSFTEVSTGFVVGGGPNAIWNSGSKLFIAGNGGYIYSTEDPTSGVTVLDAGVVFPLGTYRSIRSYSDEFVVAVGNGGAVAYTENGTTWRAISPLVLPALNWQKVWVKNKNEWWFAGSNGTLYYTLDGGQSSWAANTKTFPTASSVLDIVFATDSVAYVAVQTSATKGRIYRSTNGGYDWELLPEGGGSIPANDKINALAVCKHNPDFVVGVGLADNASDGYVTVGSD